MMALNEGTAETRTLQECYATLVEAIQDPDTLAGILFSKGILSQEILLELYAPKLSKPQKNRKILQCVQSRVVSDPSSLWTFITSLRCVPSAEHLANILVDTFRCEFSVVLLCRRFLIKRNGLKPGCWLSVNKKPLFNFLINASAYIRFVLSSAIMHMPNVCTTCDTVIYKLQ